MAENSLSIEVAPHNTYFFANASNTDIVMHTSATSQNILLGALSNHNATLHIGSNALTVRGDIIPSACNVYCLGSSNFVWKDLYLGGQTIFLGDTKLTVNTTSGDVEIRETATNSLKRLVVDEIQVGAASEGTVQRIAKRQGRIAFLNNDASTGEEQAAAELRARVMTADSNFFMANGTAASPSLCFTNSTNTGMYRSAANTIAFATTGVERMTINSHGDVDFTSNVTVAGNLIVSGTTVTLDTETVLLEDNVIVLNKNQTGTPASSLLSGVEVERGDEDNYLFVFQESTDLFKIGLCNNLQAVATRADSPTDGSFAFWDTTLNRYGFSNNIIVNRSTGNVGIGTTNPGSNALYVNGLIYATNDITAFSDARKKADLKVIDEPIERINQLTGYTFARSDKPEEDRRYVGLIAQDVQKVLPEAVYADGESYLSVAYGNIAGLLVEGIKTLTQRVDALAARMDTVEKKLM